MPINPTETSMPAVTGAASGESNGTTITVPPQGVVTKSSCSPRTTVSSEGVAAADDASDRRRRDSCFNSVSTDLSNRIFSRPYCRIWAVSAEVPADH
jgi:hypothetical protein